MSHFYCYDSIKWDYIVFLILLSRLITDQTAACTFPHRRLQTNLTLKQRRILINGSTDDGRLTLGVVEKCFFSIPATIPGVVFWVVMTRIWILDCTTHHHARASARLLHSSDYDNRNIDALINADVFESSSLCRVC